MKLIKNFKKFFDNRKIDSICKEYDITDYTINSDGSIDVDCSVYIRFKRLTKLPLKFGRVSGDFDCSHNNLTSLEGCPGWVGRNFDCHNNNLTSLEGGPESVGDDFDCHNNNLTSLKGSPSSIEDDFVCHNNKLTTLEGGPRVVNGKFDCSGNQLTNLIGGPRVVNGKFDCSSNQLTNLIGGPEWVKYDYVASNNQITSFEGFPDKHNDDCEFYGNPVNKILREFPHYLWRRAIPLIIDYDAIWNGEIVPERLEMVKEKLPKSAMKKHFPLWPYRPVDYDIDYDD